MRTCYFQYRNQVGEEKISQNKNGNQNKHAFCLILTSFQFLVGFQIMQYRNKHAKQIKDRRCVNVNQSPILKIYVVLNVRQGKAVKR